MDDVVISKEILDWMRKEVGYKSQECAAPDQYNVGFESALRIVLFKLNQPEK